MRGAVVERPGRLFSRWLGIPGARGDPAGLSNRLAADSGSRGDFGLLRLAPSGLGAEGQRELASLLIYESMMCVMYDVTMPIAWPCYVPA